MQLVDHVERGLALGSARQARHRVVARAHVGVDVGQRRLRLDDEAAPALEVEPERHVVGHRVAAAHVDVGALLLAGEHEIEVVVLEVLRVGELHHFARCVAAPAGYQWRNRSPNRGPPVGQFHDAADHRCSAGSLLSRYEVVFCDVWGVMHNGRKAYAEAGAALARFRAEGGTVILVSNAPIPASGVERVLEKTGVRRDAWDAIVSSGDIALRHIAEKGYRRLHWVGPSERDYALYVRLPEPSAPLAQAEAIVCTGLVDDRNETVADYRP